MYCLNKYCAFDDRTQCSLVPTNKDHKWSRCFNTVCSCDCYYYRCAVLVNLHFLRVDEEARAPDLSRIVIAGEETLLYAEQERFTVIKRANSRKSFWHF